ncbi:LOW QUALITY PROTEIN: F-box/LRR-repeat protein 5-like [Amphiura filiformis]|uniref:LOW QUALITY PROTEIN: F-box/LRR-repeat protein 5-like n=1 Tax=Amphiura filiformis TaxID=82378 RepID=UPI003B20CB32
MSLAPAEVDVFTGPHSRMKRLVERYSAKLTATDFSSYSDLKLLLCSLINTFKEFKTHERIENECIMQKLKNRLKFLQIEVKEVTKIHSDNKLSEMLELFEQDCKAMNHCHIGPGEMINIGEALRKALGEFNEDFIPHMKEEEEIFQPLLMEYFTYDELKAIKSDVIQRHLRLTKYKRDSEKDDSGVEVQDKEEEEDEDDTAKILSLPTEITLEIFSYLGPRDLLRSAQVCSSWSGLARDPSLWKTLHPVQWAQGDWKFHSISDIPSEPDPWDIEDDTYVVVDEDADFDESHSSGESDTSDSSQASRTAMGIRREAKMLDDMSKYLIPYIGSGVENVVLARSKGLTNGVVYRILVKCPNLKHLDLSMTKVNDIAFKGLGKDRAGSQLKHVDLSGCVSISDRALRQLSKALSEKLHDTTEPVAKRDFDKNGRLKTKQCNCGSCHGVVSSSCSVDEIGSMAPNNERTKGPRRYQHDDTNANSSSCSASKTKCCCSNSATQRLFTGGHSNTRRSSITLDHQLNSNRTGVAHGDQTGLNDALRTSRYSDHSSCFRILRRKLFVNRWGVMRVAPTIGLPWRGVWYLSLSGCYKITDAGLRFLAEGGLDNLHHLDLSGCLGVTAAGISQLAYSCPLLDHQEFFYCDNILEGPYADTASGCQNLECSGRVCCRSGE